jgi:hypothetical protein
MAWGTIFIIETIFMTGMFLCWNGKDWLNFFIKLGFLVFIILNIFHLTGVDLSTVIYNVK